MHPARCVPNSIAFYHSGKLDETTDGKRVCGRSPRAMHEAAGAPPQLTDGACAAAQSTDAAALRLILQARPLALRLHRERAIVDKTTDLCAADLHGGRAQRKDNRGPRMLARMRTHRASCRPGGGRPSVEFVVEISRCRAPPRRSTTEAPRHAADVELYRSPALYISTSLQRSTLNMWSKF